MKLLINAPSGLQQIVNVGPGGGYFDPARVIWDERADGPLPNITLGGMVRVGNALQLDANLLAADTALRNAATAETARLAAISAEIAGDTTLVQLKAMTAAEFDTWWTANVTTLAQASAVLKRLARVVIRRVL